MSCNAPDAVPEIGVSADALETLPEKYLDLERLTCAFVADVLSGKRNYDERFHCRPAEHHSRARYLDRAGAEHWLDVRRGDLFEVTDEVRTRVQVERDRQ